VKLVLMGLMGVDAAVPADLALVLQVVHEHDFLEQHSGLRFMISIIGI
jgi:hypothetical protein